MIQNISGCAGVLPIECVSPRKNKWKIRWNIIENEDGTAEWAEQCFDHKPTDTEILGTIVDYYNKKVDEKILSGYRWHDMPVWLSTENQFNYKSVYDLASQDETILPIKFKMGEDAEGNVLYHTFVTLDELRDFYMGAIQHIQQCLNEGWELKDGVSIDTYKL